MDTEPDPEDKYDGVLAYVRIHRWFTQVSGMAMVERRNRIMRPEKCGYKAKKDEDVIRCLEAWKLEMEEIRKASRIRSRLTRITNSLP